MTVFSRISRNCPVAVSAEREGLSVGLSPDTSRHLTHFGVSALIILALALDNAQALFPKTAAADTQTGIKTSVLTVPPFPGVEPVGTTERLHQIISKEFSIAGVTVNDQIHFTGPDTAKVAETGAMTFLNPLTEGIYKIKPGTDQALSNAAREALSIFSFSIPPSDNHQLIVLEYSSQTKPVFGGVRVTEISKYLVGTQKGKNGWEIIFSLPFKNLPLPKDDENSGYTPVDRVGVPYYLERDGAGAVYMIFSACRQGTTDCSFERKSEMVRFNFGQ